jgi:hypothetical protein
MRRRRGNHRGAEMEEFQFPLPLNPLPDWEKIG